MREILFITLYGKKLNQNKKKEPSAPFYVYCSHPHVLESANGENGLGSCLGGMHGHGHGGSGLTSQAFSTLSQILFLPLQSNKMSINIQQFI